MLNAMWNGNDLRTTIGPARPPAGQTRNPLKEGVMNAKRILGIFLALAFVAAAGSAGIATSPIKGYRRVVQLTPTEAGDALNAQGVVQYGIKNGVEYFGVRVFADLPDGAVVDIRVRDQKGQEFAVAKLEMFLGSGSMQVWSSKDPSDVFPVTDLSGVSVYEGGMMILDASL
jgi:hypothetical protein